MANRPSDTLSDLMGFGKGSSVVRRKEHSEDAESTWDAGSFVGWMFSWFKSAVDARRLGTGFGRHGGSGASFIDCARVDDDVMLSLVNILRSMAARCGEGGAKTRVGST